MQANQFNMLGAFQNDQSDMGFQQTLAIQETNWNQIEINYGDGSIKLDDTEVNVGHGGAGAISGHYDPAFTPLADQLFGDLTKNTAFEQNQPTQINPIQMNQAGELNVQSLWKSDASKKAFKLYF